MHGHEYRGGRGRRQRPLVPASLVAMRSTSLRAGAAVRRPRSRSPRWPWAAGPARHRRVRLDRSRHGRARRHVAGGDRRPRPRGRRGIHFDGGTGRPLVVRADGDTAKRIPIPVDPGAGTIQFQDAADGRRPNLGRGIPAQRHADGRLAPTRPVALVEADRSRWRRGRVARRGRAARRHALGRRQVPHAARTTSRWSNGSTARPGTWWPRPRSRARRCLKDVAVTPDGGAWAVGWSVHDEGVTRPLIERWDGTGWSTASAHGQWAAQRGRAPSRRRRDRGRVATAADGDRTLTLRSIGRDRGSRRAGDRRPRPARLGRGRRGRRRGRHHVRRDGRAAGRSWSRWDDGWTPVDVTGEPAPEPGGDQLLAITGELGPFAPSGSATRPRPSVRSSSTAPAPASRGGPGRSTTGVSGQSAV